MHFRTGNNRHRYFFNFTYDILEKCIDKYLEELTIHCKIDSQIDAAFTKFPKEMVASKDITIQFLSNGFPGVTAWWLRDSFPYTSEEMAAHLFTLFKPYTKYLK